MAVTRKTPLRAVTKDDAAPAAATSLKEAALRSERELLVMMRGKIAGEIDGGVPPHTLAPLARQLREIDKEIRLLDSRARQEADEDDCGDGSEPWNQASI